MAQNAKYMSLGAGVDDNTELEGGLQDAPHPPPPEVTSNPERYTLADELNGFRDDAQFQEKAPLQASNTSRPVSISSVWSGYQNEARAFRELPADADPRTDPLTSWESLPEGTESEHLDPLLYRRRFERSTQLRILVWRTLFKWFFSVALILGIIFTLIFYGRQEVIGSTQKRIFNTLITGLSLFLGLNIASAFKDQMLAVRWKVLARRTHTAKQVELILSFDSMTKNLQLILKSSSYLLLRIGLVLWLAFNFSAQIGLAILGLTYELNNLSSHTLGRPGIVSVPDIRAFTPGWNQTPIFDGNDQFISHLYGDISTSYKKSQLDPIKNANDGSIYNYDAERQVFTYRFKEFDTTDASQFTFSNRTVTTQSFCNEYPVDAGPSGWSDPFTVTFPTGKEIITTSLAGVSSVIYILPGQLDVGSASWCDQRCARIWIFQAPVVNSPDSSSHFFACNVTVSLVSNAYDPVHNLSDGRAGLAAAAIALTGYTNTSEPLNAQFENNRYISTSYWGAPSMSGVQGFQSLTAEFAIGAIASMGEFNLRVNVSGSVPLQGSKLDVDWLYSGLVLGLLGVGQLIVVLAMSVWASSVIVRDDGYLATARILRPFVKPFGRAGCLVDGEAIAGSYGKKEFLYGVRTLHMEPEDKHHLEIGPVDKKLKPQHYFPEGEYD